MFHFYLLGEKMRFRTKKVRLVNKSTLMRANHIAMITSDHKMGILKEGNP